MIINQNSSSVIKLVLIILLQIFGINNAEFYSSVHEMSLLVDFETNLLRSTEAFVSENEGKIDYLKARLADFEQEREEAVASGPAYLNNPVNQYLMTKRLTLDWERIVNLMEHKTAEKSLEYLKKQIQNRNISFVDELNGGIDGILRIQEVYRLNTKDIAMGELSGVKYSQELSTQLCFDIGVRGIAIGKYRLAHSWLMEAQRRLSKNNDESIYDEPLENAHILAALADAKTKLGDIRGANATYTKLLELKPDSQVLARTYMVFMLEHDPNNSTDIDYNEDHPPIPDDPLKTPQHVRWKLTCSGHIKKTPSEKRDLRCGYLTETHPFLILGPLKVEELSLDPLLVQYYDVLSDSEIEEMKQIANHRVTRAKVMGLNAPEVSKVRTSQYVFIPKTNHKVLQTIDQRVGYMTNLNMNYAEDHQFQNYGIGGHYGEHHDFFHDLAMKTPNRINKRYLGNRIATVLFYLTDVEQGGGTAFPYLKTLLMPKKGAAAFWHNLHAAGEPDKRTLHGGCPIIVGSKWVLNRWIREYNQDATRPCDVYFDGVFGPL